MKELDVVFSPICEANGAFLNQLEEWFSGTGIRINRIPFQKLDPESAKWYESGGLMQNGRFLSTVFIDVFCEGKLIDSVPLSKEKLERELQVELNSSENKRKGNELVMTADMFRSLTCGNEIVWEPITPCNYFEEMRMCLTNYPYGNPPERFHRECTELKSKIFAEVFQKEDIAGLFASYDNKVIGLVEVFPREILKRHGFLTGTGEPDGEILTVGCLEAGFGIPRKEMIDELFFRLEKIFRLFKRKRIEGIGVYEWNEGFTPYWVYDKYGYKKAEEITKKKVVMVRSINK